MQYAVKLGKCIGVIYLISLIFAFVRGFSLLEWINASFIVAMLMFVLSGIYYLNAQGAYIRLGHSMKKFYYAIVELFSAKDYSKERQKMAEYTPRKVKLAKESEMTVASVAILLFDIVISYVFYC